jgi:transcriptional regulator with XRE-family HTH domain
MEWKGDKLKEIAKSNGVSIAKLTQITGVSRQTVTGWINGQTPKGNHLMALLKLFNISPDFFFAEEPGHIAVPAHRSRQNAKITPRVQNEALSLAKEYEFLFKNESDAGVWPVVRLKNRDVSTAQKIATDLRSMSGVGKDQPMNAECVFKLLSQLGIKVIFRYFPDTVKAYAFYTRVYDHRVIFVNNHTKELDLIFALIHEGVHAIRDNIKIADVYDKEEEDFCDLVANHVQFPDKYVDLSFRQLKSLNIPNKVTMLKNIAFANKHALFGFVKRLEGLGFKIPKTIGGANSNLRKRFVAFGDILFDSENLRHFLYTYQKYSPMFYNVVLRQLDSLTTRKIGQIFGMDSYLDAKALKEELFNMRDLI